MISHQELTVTALRHHIKTRQISFAGNRQLKIYGTLRCLSGKRMKKSNRVFFKSATEALQEGFRPCGHCLPLLYRQWKEKQ